MSELLRKIHNYLISKGQDEESLMGFDTSSVYLSMEIMEYAHRNQKRENGEDYANHPARCLQIYRDLVGIDPNDYFCIDSELMRKVGIPFEGVQEVCLLHDVIEDTELTLEDIKELFTECGFENYFNIHIEQPLKNITHDKSVPYDIYIDICMNHPTSALAKMIDLQDNSFVFSLLEFNEKNYERTQRYMSYIYRINNAYHFIENTKIYNRLFAEGRK